MKQYRLKPEAVQFFKKDLATQICDFDSWNDIGVDEKALEKVEDAHLKFGYPLSDNGTSLSGWNEKGTHFHFTIFFPSVKHCEHDKFTNGKHTRKLMDKIQSQINYFYQDFVNNEE